jgi:hypothetical protein
MVMMVAALLFGVADLWHSYVPSYGETQLITMGRLWLLISARSMTIVESVIQRHIWGPIWDFGISPVLVIPAWTFFLGLGVLFFLFGRPNPADQ